MVDPATLDAKSFILNARRSAELHSLCKVLAPVAPLLCQFDTSQPSLGDIHLQLAHLRNLMGKYEPNTDSVGKVVLVAGVGTDTVGFHTLCHVHM